MEIVTPYGRGTILSLPNIHYNYQHDDHDHTHDHNHDKHDNQDTNTSNLIVRLHTWTMADGKSPTAYLGYYDNNHEHNNHTTLTTLTDTEQQQQQQLKHQQKQHITKYYARNHDIQPLSTFLYQTHVLAHKRSYSLDLTPGLLYADGDAVSGMIQSGVSEYCEFKSLLGLYLCMPEPTATHTPTKNFGGVGFANWSTGGSTATTAQTKPNGHDDSGTTTDASNVDAAPPPCRLSKVPCSKGDVFQTKLLSPVDKRRLMKFLQLASDYATATAHTHTPDAPTTTTSAEEKEGATPTVESSPTPSTTATEEETVTSLNERRLQQGRSLYRPQNKTVATSALEILRSRIRTDTRFDTYLEKEHGLGERLRGIVVHAMAMGGGGNGGSGGYTVGDGMGDLCRHLSSLGRYGGTAFLVPLYGAGELSQAFCRSAAVHGGTYLLRRNAERVMVEDGRAIGIRLGGDRRSEDGRATEDGGGKMVRAKHVVVSEDALLTEGTGGTAAGRRVLRRISVLRGRLIRNDDISKKTTTVTDDEQRHVIIFPPGTIGNPDVVRGIVLDGGVNVAPRNDGGCVLHLTTTMDGTYEDGRTVGQDDVLARAVRTLLRGSDDGGDDDGVEELYHVSYSYLDRSHGDGRPATPDGLHVSVREGPSVTVDGAFGRAREIFERVCPGSGFLQLSEAMEDIVKDARRGCREDEEDHDETLLESAMGMVESKPAEVVEDGVVPEIGDSL